jgi:hypothetical protein
MRPTLPGIGLFSEAEFIRQTLRQIATGNFHAARFFLCCLRFERGRALMESLIESRSPDIFVQTQQIRTGVELRWMEMQLFCALDDGMPLFPMIVASTVDAELAQLNYKPFKQIVSALADVEKRPGDLKRIADFVRKFLKFMKESRVLANVLLSKCQQYFSKIPIEQLYKEHLFDAFNLLPSIDPMMVTGLDFEYTKAKDMEVLFQIPAIVRRSEIADHIQNQIMAKHFWPDCTPYESEREIRSLVDTTILSSVHFIDRIRKLSKHFFDSDNFPNAYKAASQPPFQGIGLWIFVSHAAKHFARDFHEFSSALANVQEPPSAISDLIQRFKNDERFYAQMRAITGQIFTSEDLGSRSVPAYLLQFLTAADAGPFYDFHNNALFCISDRDRIQDSDFAWSYFATDAMLRMLAAPEIEMEALEHMESYVRNVRNTVAKRGIVADLFSLIFLEVDGRFMCKRSKAEVLITSLIGLSDDKELVRCGIDGHLHLQLAHVCRPGEDLRDAFIPVQALLYNALRSEQWERVDVIASISPRDAPFIRVFKSVRNFAQKKFLDRSSDHLALCEISLCFAYQKTLVEARDLPDEAVEVLTRRQKAKSENHIKCIKTLKKVYLNPIIAKFTKMSATQWDLPTLAKNVPVLRLLSSFSSYLDRLVPLVLTARLVENVAAALKMNPYQRLHGLLRAGKMTEAEDMAVLLQQDLREIVLMDGSYSTDVIRRFMPDHPVVILASMLTARGVQVGDELEPETVCGRLYYKRLPQGSRAAETVAAAAQDRLIGFTTKLDLPDPESLPAVRFGTALDGFGEDAILRGIEALLAQPTANAVTIAELSFSVDRSVFSELLMRRAENGNIEALAAIAANAAVDGHIFDRLEFLAQVSSEDRIAPFPLAECLKRLFLWKRFQKGSRFLALFENVCDCVTALVECIRGSDDKLGVYHRAGRLKVRVLDALGISEADLSNVHLEAIPRAWWSPSASAERMLSDHIGDDPDTVVSILGKFPQFDLDSGFLNFVLTILDQPISQLIAAIGQFLPVCRNVSRFLGHLSPHLEKKVDALSIVDAEGEEAALSGLIGLDNLLRRSESSTFSRRVSVLRAIVEHRPQTVYGLSYRVAHPGDRLYDL